MQTLSDILGVIEPRNPAKREVALSRLAALRAAKDCPPAAVSGNPRSVTAPVGPLQPGGTRLSNLDIHGRLVKKGLVVSHHGLRFLVTKVSRGWFYGQRIDAWGHAYGLQRSRLQCESVQVVASVSRKAAPPVSRVGAKGAALPLCN